MYHQQTMDFSEWLVAELAERGWSRSEAARRGNISPSMFDKVINGHAKPGVKFLDGLAQAFIDARDYTERTASLTAQIDTVQKEIDNLQKSRLKIETRHAELTQLSKALAALEPYLLNAPSHEVNNQLRSLIDRIELTPTTLTPRIIWDK